MMGGEEAAGPVHTRLHFIQNEQGAAHSVVFTPRAGVIEFRPGSDPVKFLAKLKQLAEALAQ